MFHSNIQIWYKSSVFLFSLVTTNYYWLGKLVPVAERGDCVCRQRDVESCGLEIMFKVRKLNTFFQFLDYINLYITIPDPTLSGFHVLWGLSIDI